MAEALCFVDDGGGISEGKMQEELKTQLKTFVQMRKAGVPLVACVQRASIQQDLTPAQTQAFVLWCQRRKTISAADLERAFSPGNESKEAKRPFVDVDAFRQRT